MLSVGGAVFSGFFGDAGNLEIAVCRHRRLDLLVRGTGAAERIDDKCVSSVSHACYGLVLAGRRSPLEHVMSISVRCTLCGCNLEIATVPEETHKQLNISTVKI